MGAAVNLFSRQVRFVAVQNQNLLTLCTQMNIVGYADEVTRSKLGSRQEKTFAMIKPDAVHRAGAIIEAIETNNFTICAAKQLTLSRQNAEGTTVSLSSLRSELLCRVLRRAQGQALL